jgi:hypothetical protein
MELGPSLLGFLDKFCDGRFGEIIFILQLPNGTTVIMIRRTETSSLSHSFRGHQIEVKSRGLNGFTDWTRTK